MSIGWLVIAYVPHVLRPEAFFRETRGGGRAPVRRHWWGNGGEHGWRAGYGDSNSAMITDGAYALVLHDPEDISAGQMGRARFEEVTRCPKDTFGWTLGLTVDELINEINFVLPKYGGRLIYIDPATGQEVTP